MSEPEKLEVKRKKYYVDTFSVVNATQIVFANSKNEAFEIADREMKESLKRKIEEAPPNELIVDGSLHGRAGATKYTVKLVS